MKPTPLDQFYTSSSVARECVRFLCAKMKWISRNSVQFIEPSAGAGDFLPFLPEDTIAFDLAPRAAGIKKQDFFSYPGPRAPAKNVIIIGNPPFGIRGRLALEFCHHASVFADTIAFIVPMCFTKYGIHKNMPPLFKLIGKREIERGGFYTLDGKAYNVGAVFQIWTRRRCRLRDYRIYSPPPISHRDFCMHQYNNTRQAEHVFEKDFDFAVPCQGYQDYSRRETQPEACERTKQWMLFSFSAEQAESIFNRIDFRLLAHRQATTTPGFRKHDVVSEYSLYS